MNRPSGAARSLLLVSLLFLGSGALADADDGEYLGFKLGATFSVPDGAVGRDHITGARAYLVDPIRRLQHIGSLSVYVSPETATIGSVFGEWYFGSDRSAKHFADSYRRILEGKYPHWKSRPSTLTHGNYQLWVDIEERPPIVEHWPSEKNFRVAIALIYAPDSSHRDDWLAMLRRESGWESENLELAASQ